MSSLFLGTLVGSLLGWLMAFLSVFLVMLVLIQRGKGGGLTGALGGPGGQSAFGSKAGDTFTVITIVVASIWGFTCAFTMWLLGTHTSEPVAKAKIQAGPGDSGDAPASMPLDFSTDSVPSGAGFGIGADPDTETGTTPAMDLVPANRPAEQPAGTAADTTDEATNTDDTAEKPPAAAAADTPDSSPGETPEGSESSGDPPPADQTDSR